MRAEEELFHNRVAKRCLRNAHSQALQKGPDDHAYGGVLYRHYERTSIDGKNHEHLSGNSASDTWLVCLFKERFYKLKGCIKIITSQAPFKPFKGRRGQVAVEKVVSVFIKENDSLCVIVFDEGMDGVQQRDDSIGWRLKYFLAAAVILGGNGTVRGQMAIDFSDDLLQTMKTFCHTLLYLFHGAVKGRFFKLGGFFSQFFCADRGRQSFKGMGYSRGFVVVFGFESRAKLFLCLRMVFGKLLEEFEIEFFIVSQAAKGQTYTKAREMFMSCGR